MIKFLSNNKFIFYSANIFLLIEYFFRGSFIGCILYGDCSIQPYLVSNFVISLNHFFAFFILTLIGFFTFIGRKSYFFLLFYLLILSISLEISHFFISYRNFELADLFGNLIGVLVVFFTNFFYRKYENFKN